jgi:hypothetical protein
MLTIFFSYKKLINDKEIRLGWFWPKISHMKGDSGLILESPFKMVWLILDTENYGGTGRIDVISDVYMEVGRAKWTDVTSS